jgi:hypothetical protein
LKVISCSNYLAQQERANRVAKEEEHVAVRPLVAVADPERVAELRPPRSVFIFFACRHRPRLGFLSGRTELAKATLAKACATLRSGVNMGAFVL